MFLVGRLTFFNLTLSACFFMLYHVEIVFDIAFKAFYSFKKFNLERKANE